MSSQEASNAINAIITNCPITVKLITQMSVNIVEMDIKEVDDTYKNWKKEMKEMKKKSYQKRERG